LFAVPTKNAFEREESPQVKDGVVSFLRGETSPMAILVG
jgi:hypothetical protein